MIVLTCEAEGRAKTRGLRRSSHGSMPPFAAGRRLHEQRRQRPLGGDTRAMCTHLFNHQTHHGGQVHVMLSQTSVGPPALDFHRIVNPWGIANWITGSPEVTGLGKRGRRPVQIDNALPCNTEARRTRISDR